MKCTILHSNGFLLRNINRWEVCITVFCSIIRINLNFSNLLSYIEPNSMQIFNLGIYFTIYHEPDGLIPCLSNWFICAQTNSFHAHPIYLVRKSVISTRAFNVLRNGGKFLSGPERSYSSLSTNYFVCSNNYSGCSKNYLLCSNNNYFGRSKDYLAFLNNFLYDQIISAPKRSRKFRDAPERSGAGAKRLEARCGEEFFAKSQLDQHRSLTRPFLRQRQIEPSKEKVPLIAMNKIKILVTEGA